jgi:uncharacterized protein HemX
MRDAERTRLSAPDLVAPHFDLQPAIAAGRAATAGSRRVLVQPTNPLKKLKIVLKPRPGCVLGSGNFRFPAALSPMIEVPPQDAKTHGIVPSGAQPIALAAAALVVILFGVGAIALWRVSTGTSPEQERVVAARQLQARTAQASEQLVEKTKGLEATQQESIDQLQVVQDQLQTVKRLLAGQQAEAKRLSEQISGLTEAIEGLRQSFASAQAPEASGSPSQRNKSIRTRARATNNAHRRHAKSRG